ncbi:MAG: PAS domain-containing sensor histidine kinase [Phototrophicaceae bacterium]
MSDMGLEQRIKELEAQVAELRIEKAKLQLSNLQQISFLNATTDAVVILSDHAVMEQWNAAFFRLFGYDNQDLLGISTDILYQTEMISDGLRPAQFVESNLYKPRLYEVICRRKDQTEFPAQQFGIKIRDENGILMGYLLIIRDVSERAEAEHLLVEYYQRLEERVQARTAELNAYAHTVAHDIKNPLATIISLADFYHHVDEADRKGIIQKVEQVAYKAYSIVNELLLLSSMQRLERVNLSHLESEPLVSAALRRLTLLIDEYKPQIKVRSSWIPALGYAPWIEEVWMNYISNAIKYGGNPPLIEIGCSEGESKTVRFWVRDYGEGIPPEKQAQLFMQVTDLDLIRAQGHGLGLSIVKRIIDKHNGQVFVESEVGKGSTFGFILPRE